MNIKPRCLSQGKAEEIAVLKLCFSRVIKEDKLNLYFKVSSIEDPDKLDEVGKLRFRGYKVEYSAAIKRKGKRCNLASMIAYSNL